MSDNIKGLHLHFDPVSGIAGDMAVAALVDAGVPAAVVSDAVASMGVPGLRVSFEPRRRGAFVGQGFVVHEPGTQRAKAKSSKPGATNAKSSTTTRGATARGTKKNATKSAASHSHDHVSTDVHAHGEDHHGHAHAHEDAGEHSHAHAHDHHSGHAHRDYAEIRRLLRNANFDDDAKALAEDIFARIAEVEAALHGTSVDRVAFHEVGAFDSIADIVGVSAAIAYLAPGSIGSSPPVLGSGIIRTAHGPMAVPAPATAALLKDVPVIFEGVGELTTPTGAALLASVVDAFGSPPPMTLVGTGFGAGTRELADRANVLRVMLGRPVGQADVASADAAVLVQANIDDMSPQLLAALMDALFAAGALDVWATPILMKKGRPASEISALVESSKVDALRRAFFLNSSTLGIRMSSVDRSTLSRSFASVATLHGNVRIKISAWDGQPLAGQPEYEDCRRLAAAAGISVKRVWTDAMVAAQSLVTPASTAATARAPISSSRQRKGSKAKTPSKRGRAE